MKILMAWELDSDISHIHHLRLISHYLREMIPDCHITLACTQSIEPEHKLYFDDIFVTNRIQLKHPSEATGVILGLSSLGWIAPDLRQPAFSSWSKLYKKVKPDLVIAESSPGAILSAILEEIPVIQSSNGKNQVTKEDLELNEYFPEFQIWLWSLIGQTYAQALNKPGLVFCPKSIDDERSGLIFNVNPAKWPWEDTPRGSQEAVIYSNVDGSGGSYSDINGAEGIQKTLAENGITSIIVNKIDPVNTDHTKLIIGGFDKFSMSLAASIGAPYLGLNSNNRVSESAIRAIRNKSAYSFSSTSDLELIINSVRGVAPRVGEFTEIPVALSHLVRN